MVVVVNGREDRDDRTLERMGVLRSLCRYAQRVPWLWSRSAMSSASRLEMAMTSVKALVLPDVTTSHKGKSDEARDRFFGPFTSSEQIQRVMRALENGLDLRQKRFELKFGTDEAQRAQRYSGYLTAIERDVAAVADEIEAQGNNNNNNNNNTSKQRRSAVAAAAELRTLLDVDESEAAMWQRVSDRASAAAELQALLDLPRDPRRIEGFDVSR